MRDVQISFGLDKGGTPSSVKVVVGILNQAHPHRLANSMLLAVCPCENDTYEDIEKMLRTHMTALQDLLLNGVVLDGHLPAAHLFLTGDYTVLCVLLGHNGPNATLPCLKRLGTRVPSKAQFVLDEAFGTIQELSLQHLPRTSDQLLEILGKDISGHVIAGQGGVDKSLSINLPPILVVDPRQVVPIPFHLTIGIKSLILRLAVESIIVSRGPVDGLQFGYGLADVRGKEFRVHPVPYHGSNFIGRHCHVIAPRSVRIGQELTGLLSDARVAANKKAWEPWSLLLPTLNRAVIIPAPEQTRFADYAREFVALLKRHFPWVRISPKLHFLFHHAAEFMRRFGSIGLYFEQAIEARHGIHRQNAPRFTAETELLSCGRLMRSMALTSVATDAMLRLLSPILKRASKWATRSDDRRRQDNKPGRRHCRSTTEKAENDRRSWAGEQFDVALMLVSSFGGHG